MLPNISQFYIKMLLHVGCTMQQVLSGIQLSMNIVPVPFTVGFPLTLLFVFSLPAISLAIMGAWVAQ